MRKILVLLMMMCFCNVANAQKEYNAYCLIRMDGLKKQPAEIQLPETDGVTKLKDKDGKTIKFNNYSDMLTYMGERGWEHVSYVSGGSYTFDWFVMQKKVKSNEEIYERLYIDEKDIKKEREE